ncbi:Photosynthetic NDH subunit of lumenal location 1, chloroplastic, partial [Linum grandiflorum]
ARRFPLKQTRTDNKIRKIEKKDYYYWWSKKKERNTEQPKEMAVASSLSLSLFSSAASSKRVTLSSLSATNDPTVSLSSVQASPDEASNLKRRRELLVGFGGAVAATASTLIPIHSASAEEMMKMYQTYIDREDGYTYIYPSDWRDFDFRGHDSAFKDRYMQLQNVRVRFIPTKKKDIHEFGPMEQVIGDLIGKVYAAPNQRPTIYSMEEKNVEGTNYYTFEYELRSPNYASVSFATIAIGNGRYYTLIVGANERRWKRYRNQLKVVADSFKLLEI